MGRVPGSTNRSREEGTAHERARLRNRPSTNPGPHQLPLYSPKQIKAFLKHQYRGVDPVCACCYGVLYWLVGDLATQTVNGYLLLAVSAVSSFVPV